MSIFIKFLLLASLIFGLMLVLCMGIGMGRVWSLYFMLQIVSNIRNYDELRIPANVNYILKLLDEISNFRISAVE